MRCETVGDNKQKRQQTTKTACKNGGSAAIKFRLRQQQVRRSILRFCPAMQLRGAHAGGARLGFSDTGSFSSVFRKHVGLTPAEPATAWNKNFLLHADGGRAPIRR